MGLVEPQIPVWRSHDLSGLELIRGIPPDWEFGHHPRSGDSRYRCAIEGRLHEPQSMVRAADDSTRCAVWCWDRKLGEFARRRHAANSVGPELGNPEIAV